MARPSHSFTPTSAQPLSAGRVIGGKFEVIGVLGEGGTGIVYDAERLPDRERLALKVIHPHLAGDEQIRGRFTREAAILRRLEGDHLCPILEFGEIPDPRREDAGLLYMALPKIEGPALDTLLKTEGPLSVERAIDILLQVCEGLKEAHAQGVIHRDLKPGNVLLRGGTHAVVVDFGMAKIVTGGGVGTTALTQHNMVFGTPEYMAPEQARGDELDARCDVYAVGVMAYELLTGVVPFSGATPLNVLTAHLTTPARAPRERAPNRGISPALEAVVLHALAKEAPQRYASALELASAMKHAQVAPDDLESVRPLGRVSSDVPDAHAATLPAPMPSVPPALGGTSTRPPSRRSGRPTIAPATARPSHGWTLIWILAALVGISIGVWLSLRH